MASLDQVWERLLERDLTQRVRDLAVAACTGPEALEAVLDDPGRAATPPTDAGDEQVAAPGIHLRAVRATGFRGIGAEARLDLPPGPGLTLVVGRNGSGKSSFAEAVEFALTGDNRRWSRRSRVWRDGWRNLHHDGAAEVVARFSLDGRTEPLEVARRWPAEAPLDDNVLDVDGDEAEAEDLDALGWKDALELYRPFLPYSELGAMVDEGPTALHDTLSAVLGLDVLTDGAKALRDARLVRERALKASRADGAALAAELADVDDDRARRAATLLQDDDGDLDAIVDLLGDEGADTAPALDVLRQLATLAGPDLDAVRHAADRLDDAARAVADTRGTDSERDLQAAELLQQARAFHALHGDGDCPVCGAGGLDGPWAERAQRLEQELRAGARQVQGAVAGLAVARDEVASLARAVPAVLRRAGVAGIDARLATETWEAFAAVTGEADDRERAVAVRRRADALHEALADLRARARAELARRDDQWRPHVQRVADWVRGARAARDGAAPVDDLRAAERAVLAVHDDVRAERWTPIADQARSVWDALRQASNVAIDDVALAGSGTRRRVEVSVTVDGIAGAALGVMSQGELHALALSLFLPRATLAESPFRFLVLDDPVQSMDAARVEGLARVLGDVAADRQVVVFTHDDRLTDAVRRLGVPASVLEVTRGAGSVVDVRPVAAG